MVQGVASSDNRKVWSSYPERKTKKKLLKVDVAGEGENESDTAENKANKHSFIFGHFFAFDRTHTVYIVFQSRRFLQCPAGIERVC